MSAKRLAGCRPHTLSAAQRAGRAITDSRFLRQSERLPEIFQAAFSCFAKLPVKRLYRRKVCRVPVFCSLSPQTPPAGAPARRSRRRARGTRPTVCLSVTGFPCPSGAARGRTGRGVLMFQPENFAARSQDLVHVWHGAGSFIVD